MSLHYDRGNVTERAALARMAVRGAHRMPQYRGCTTPTGGVLTRIGQGVVCGAGLFGVLGILAYIV